MGCSTLRTGALSSLQTLCGKGNTHRKSRRARSRQEFSSCSDCKTLTMRSGTTRCLPHLLLGLLEALRHEVNLLEGSDETLLVAGRLRVKHLYTCLFRQGMLGKTSADKHHFHRACVRACMCASVCVRVRMCIVCVTLNSPIDDSKPAP